MLPRTLVVGDTYMPADIFRRAFGRVGWEERCEFLDVDAARTPAGLEGLVEFQGDPEQLDEHLDGHEILAVHAAPVTAALLDANPSIRLIACARGGPVNIDLDAAAARGVTVTTTPGKNAEAVADLTICFLTMLLRQVLDSAADVRHRAQRGDVELDSTFGGIRWMGREPGGRTIGLVGLGSVGRLVSERAEKLGMRVVGHDPYVDPESVAPFIETMALPDLLAQSDVVSLHARATDENRHLIGADQLARMPAGALLINTARESLVDEDALVGALHAGRLGGAALDVCEPRGRWPELAATPNVFITPHIGGATSETRDRGMQMVIESIRRYLKAAGR